MDAHNCVFCSIVLSNIPNHEIWWQNDTHVAFLDKNPTQKGHTLVIPRTHIENVLDMDIEAHDSLYRAVREVSLIMRDFFHISRIGTIVEGFSVPHVHIHLMPVAQSEDLGIFKKIITTESEQKQLAQDLRTTLGQQ